jgi:probable F420-dependent oxidoreductase
VARFPLMQERRVLAALGPRALRLAAERAAGTHPYLVVPDFTRHARGIIGAEALLAPEHKAVVSTDATRARAIGRAFVEKPYLGLRKCVNNLLRHGFTADGVRGAGSDRLIDALLLHRGGCDVPRRRRPYAGQRLELTGYASGVRLQ